MAVTKIKPIKGTLNKALDYIQNPAKTDEKMLVSSFGCSYETADIEFGFTLSQALDKGNNLAHHLIQSFEPGEVDYGLLRGVGFPVALCRLYHGGDFFLFRAGQLTLDGIFYRAAYCFSFCH